MLQRSSEAKPFASVCARLNGFTPIAMLHVPANGGFQTILEKVSRGPMKFATDLGRVDGVAAVVPRPIGDESLQVVVAVSLRERRIAGGWPQLLESVADSI